MTERRELWVACGHCGWVWVCYAPLPAPVEIVCRAAKHAACPACDKRPIKVVIAIEAQIVEKLKQAGA